MARTAQEFWEQEGPLMKIKLATMMRQGEVSGASVRLYYEQQAIRDGLAQLLFTAGQATDESKTAALNASLRGFALLLQGCGYSVDEVCAAMIKRGWASYRATYGHAEANKMLKEIGRITNLKTMTGQQLAEFDGERIDH